MSQFEILRKFAKEMCGSDDVKDEIFYYLNHAHVCVRSHKNSQFVRGIFSGLKSARQAKKRHFGSLASSARAIIADFHSVESDLASWWEKPKTKIDAKRHDMTSPVERVG